MITKAIQAIKKVFIPKSEYEFETQTSLLEKKNIHCKIDDEDVDCKEVSTTPYTGVPAPVVLSNDSWFGDVTYKSQKQLDYMEKETEMKRQEREQNFSVEPEDIHQKMYEIATKNQNTTLQLNPLGGSENFHEGPVGWMSGNGMGQFQK